MTILELRQKKAQAVSEARQILDRADSEKRALTTEENQQYDNVFAGIELIDKRIEREEQLEREERAMAEITATPVRPTPPSDNTGVAKTLRYRQTPEAAEAFGRFLRGGTAALTGEEYRALQADNPAGGGYLIPPEQFVTDLIMAADNQTFMRSPGWATKFQLSTAASLGQASIDTDIDDCDWTSELATGTTDTGLALGKRVLKPNPLAKRALVSNELIRQTAIENIVRARLGYKFGIAMENGYLNGTGAGQPLGVFTASNDGVPTSRDVSTSNTATAITFDGLTEAKYTLKGAYFRNAKWLFHRDAVKQLVKIKDGNGVYMWRGAVQNGEPNMLMDVPVAISEYVPNTFTAGLYVGMIADFSYYHIVDSMDLQIQRLVELYALTNQTAFIGRLQTDGQPVLAEAFVRVKLGS